MFVPQDTWGGNDADGLCTFVDTRDVAAVCTAVLRQGPADHDGQIYTLTGPEAVSMSRVAELISSATGREVRHHPRTETESEAFLTSLGLPALRVAILLGLDQFCREGSMSEVHPDTASVLGRPARTVAAFVAEHAAQLPQLTS
jgi:nucleoside-diphosphate-sugar epimerase